MRLTTLLATGVATAATAAIDELGATGRDIERRMRTSGS